MIWREKRVPLLVLAVFLLANAIFFFTYRVQYENRLRDLDDSKHQAQQRLQQVRTRRLAVDRQIAAYRKAQTDLGTIYNDRWATEPERFTALVNEIKRLAVASELVPRSFTFARTTDKDAKTEMSIGTDVVTIAFTVQGNYQQVRRLINLLELSDQFVIIDSIGLSGSTDTGVLTLNLRLKTVFRERAPAIKSNRLL